MKTATLDELKDGSELLKHSGPIAVKDGGRTIGVFHPFPLPDESIPLEKRYELFKETSAELRRQLDEKGITEEQIERDIAALRNARGRR